MKVRNLFFAVLASAAVLVGCQEKDVDYGAPSITVSPATLEFDTAAADQVITLNATRDWRLKDADELPDWITVNPVSGGASLEAQTITVSVLENKETNREQSLTFTIGLDSKTITVSQKGEGGEAQIETITIQEFINKADTENEYTIKGVVSGLANTSFKGFNLKDETGEISCAFPANFDEWFSKLSNGGTAIIRGKYSFYTSKNQHQLYQGTILDFQEGSDIPEPGPDVPENVIYYNDFDKTVAVKEGTYFPYLDSETQVDIWKNERGTGISTVTYKFNKGQSTRTTLPSDGTTKYAGSGKNAIFFGADGGYLEIDNISVSGQDFVLSFGLSHGSGPVVQSEFHVSVSPDGENWVELPYSFPNALESKTWDFASYAFSIPSDISSLCFRFLADVKSVYRLDDVMLVPSETAGNQITFPNGGGDQPAEFSVSTTSINVSADAESATFKVNGNVAWTASVTEGDFVKILSGESGNGAGDVVLELTKNATDAERTAKITVTTTADVETKSYEVVLTQAKKSSEVGGTVIDVLNLAFTGMSGTTYNDWSGKQATSSAVYAGNSAGDKQSIQLRSKNNNSGVVTTTSGGKARKIVVTWNEGTSSAGDRQLDVYGKSTAYTQATDLYNADAKGTLLGSIICGTSTELEISGDYEFIGMRSKNGAMYITEIQITWE